MLPSVKAGYAFLFRDIDGLPVSGVTGSSPLHYGTTAPDKTYSEIFYEAIRDKKATAVAKPYNESTYILMSAGWDGMYGTRDDVYNFAD